MALYSAPLTERRVGGIIYNNGIASRGRINFTLAHEFGHAVLFEKLRAHDLADISIKYSEWSSLKKSEYNDSFFSPAFFEPLQLKKGKNIVSQYATINRHEWFAECFAANILNNLGQLGVLDKNWKNSLIKNTITAFEYTYDYTQITYDFSKWFKQLMKN